MYDRTTAKTTFPVPISYAFLLLVRAAGQSGCVEALQAEGKGHAMG